MAVGRVAVAVGYQIRHVGRLLVHVRLQSRHAGRSLRQVGMPGENIAGTDLRTAMVCAPFPGGLKLAPPEVVAYFPADHPNHRFLIP